MLIQPRVIIAVVVCVSIRRVRHDGIDLRECRQYLPTVPKVEGHAFGDVLDAAHARASFVEDCRRASELVRCGRRALMLAPPLRVTVRHERSQKRRALFAAQ